MNITQEAIAALEPSAPSADEVLLTVIEFCDLFQRNRRHCWRKCKAGTMKNAIQLAGKWYIYVPKRAMLAAKNRAA